ncbi:hypothetical protein LXL04_002377 [Taraxacum kok-saghyz]
MHRVEVESEEMAVENIEKRPTEPVEKILGGSEVLMGRVGSGRWARVVHWFGLTDAAMEEGKVLKNGIELVKSVSDKHLDLLRPSSRYLSLFKGHMSNNNNNDREKGKYALIKDSDDFQQGLYDKPLPCFGCGIGWFSFLIGFAFPLMWFYATFLYFGNYYRKDPRERAGLAASAIAAMGCSVILFIVVMVLVFGGR